MGQGRLGVQHLCTWGEDFNPVPPHTPTLSLTSFFASFPLALALLLLAGARGPA